MLFPLDQPAPPEPRRVAITGAGILTAHGLGWEPNAEGFRTGRTAFGPVSLFDASRQRVRVAAQVTLPDSLPTLGLTRGQSERLDRAATMLLLATRQALLQAGWQSDDHAPLILGTTAGGMSLGEQYYHRAVGEPHRHCQQPTRAVQYQAHSQARLVAEAFNLTGPITIISNACSSGADAIGHAWRLLRAGQCERAVAGGYDALCHMVFGGFDSLQALSPTTCRPFDAHRDGLALGEGAAVLALETYESARRRGATILAELAGYGSALDSYHLTQPQPEGEGALAAMQLACAAADLQPRDIHYVNAHGTGTLLNDSAEAAAINRWAGSDAPSVPVSSTKAGIGHLMGAAGAVEAVVCVMCLREQWLPPQPALETPDPICRFPIVRHPRRAHLRAVLSNSFGFGGVNASLVFRRWA